MSLITDFLQFLLSIWLKNVTPWLRDQFWPWFMKNIWPEIQKRILEALVPALDRLKHRIIDWFQEQNNEKAEKAKQKAEEAKNKAQESPGTAEAEKWEAIAQVWREVFEEYRQENEFLKKRLDEMVDETKSKVESDIASMNLDDLIQEDQDGSLRLKGSSETMALPPPQFDKEP